MDDANYLVGILPKNTREELRVSLSEYRGYTYADLRIFADTGGEHRVPTKSGITVAPERIDALIEALRATRDEAERRGLIPPAG